MKSTSTPAPAPRSGLVVMRAYRGGVLVKERVARHLTVVRGVGLPTVHPLRAATISRFEAVGLALHIEECAATHLHRRRTDGGLVA